jgi:L-ascorbate metabolism protein UlaG (beta-lactamase superfamily)
LIVGLVVVTLAVQAPDLRVTMVGNAGVLLTDGAASLLVDLPYESGAFGYMHYDPSQLAPLGRTVSVITHHHADHFHPEQFASRADWELIGPPSVTGALPRGRVLDGDSIQVGHFSVVVLPTPHTDDHRSYRIRWRGLVMHFVGDTEDPAALNRGPDVDVLFVTPWLSCAAARVGGLEKAARRIAYHLAPGGGDQICGDVEALEQGSSFALSGS